MFRTTCFFFLALITIAVHAQDAPPAATPKTTQADVSLLFPGSVPLNKKGTILLDKAHQRLILKTRLCLREGVLEMLICPKQTKEHESVLSLPGKAQVVHAGLLALGAQPGHPARFRPEYTPPSGDRIDIFVNWIDENDKPQRSRAQAWVKHATNRYFEAPLAQVPAGVQLGEGDDALRFDDLNNMLLFFGTMSDTLKKKFLSFSDEKTYQKAVKSLYDQSQPRELEADFVFAGSLFQTLDDGTDIYVAESGSLVCVANFRDAMIDVNMRSTASNDAGLLFEPWTERLPPLNTEVLVELIPAKSSEDKEKNNKEDKK